MVAKSETMESAEGLGGSLDDLRAFCAVVELGSISAAARQLETTKGGLSRRVSRLERRLGVKLLARHPRAVSPTEEGVAFHARTRDALVVLDEAADGARQARSKPRGHLRVTAPVDIGMDLLAPLVVEFRALHPQITVELIVTDVSLDLAARSIDLALRATADGLPDMGYRASTLIELTIAAYAAPAYLQDLSPPANPGELHDHSIIQALAPGGAARMAMTNARGRKETLSVQPVLRCGDFATARRMATAGGGICALPDIIAAAAVRSGELVRVLPEWHFGQAKLYAITLAGRDSPARVKAFTQFVRTKLVAMRSSNDTCN